MVLGIPEGASRRRERAQVAHVARRRLELLEAELAGIRPRSDGAGRHVALPADHSSARAPAPAPAPAPASHPGGGAPRVVPVRAGPPGALLEPDDEPWWSTPDPQVEPPPPRRADETGHVTRLQSALALAPVDDDPLGPGRPPLRVVAPPPRLEIDPDEDPRDRGARWAALAGWIEDRLPPALRGRVRLSDPGLVLLLAGLLLALALVTWTTTRSPGGDPVPAAQVSRMSADSASPLEGSTLVATSGAPAASGAPGVAAAGGTSAVVVVDVAGKVRRPGIVTLPAGSRVHEAVARAGGARPGVDLTGLNLARVLVDGEQILVGRPAGAAATGAASGTGAGTGVEGPLVNLNTATADQLDTLPGVGEVTARKILEWRTAHGTFTSVDELLEVDGIGDKTLADIKPRATV